MQASQTAGSSLKSTQRGRLIPALFFVFVAAAFSGCRTVNNDQIFTTQLGRVTHAGSAVGPLASTPLTAIYQKDTNVIGSPPPSGNTAALQVVTDNLGSYQYLNMREPATWALSYSPNSPTGHCYDLQTKADQPNPIKLTKDLNPNTNHLDGTIYIPHTPPPPQLALPCFTNTTDNPDFSPTAVSPQFVLDDALPTSVKVAALRKLTQQPSQTHLELIGLSYNKAADVTALSIASDGMSAQFPYPKVAAGPYLGMITSQSSSPTTTDGMEPLYIGHNDKSYPGAFGVAVATPMEYGTSTSIQDYYGDGSCAGQEVDSSGINSGGVPIPLVTLLSSSQLAVGTTSTKMSVGTSPTVVIPFNDQQQYYQSPTSIGGGTCSSYTQTWTGAQSALVVNTGSASISVVQIGTYPYPHGTVYVGHHPVAAVVSQGSQTPFAYVANYDDGTISEVNLTSLQQTRMLQVMPHPTSLAWGQNGALWVGGQGAAQQINISTWSTGPSHAVDGTISGMAYDLTQGALVFSLLQNGSSSSPSAGRTMANLIAYNSSPNSSYTATGVMTLSNGALTGATVMTDTAAYSASSLKSYLAFPAQTAFVPPIVTANGGDVIATATGNAFTVSIISTGSVLIRGTTPYPIRGVALSGNMLYFTMAESGSLVSLPVIYQ
jgi:hypothetical protein